MSARCLRDECLPCPLYSWLRASVRRLLTSVSSGLLGLRVSFQIFADLNLQFRIHPSVPYLPALFSCCCLHGCSPVETIIAGVHGAQESKKVGVSNQQHQEQAHQQQQAQQIGIPLARTTTRATTRTSSHEGGQHLHLARFRVCQEDAAAALAVLNDMHLAHLNPHA